MSTLFVTGASRGIGRALALELASPERELLLSASKPDGLIEVVRSVEARGGRATPLPADLSTLEGALTLGELVAGHQVDTAVHNAGLWPLRRELVQGGLERAFMVNHLAPFALQRALNEASTLKRVVFVSAGLIAAGRWDGDRTPWGEDFSPFRTYCTTKLCAAFAAQHLAETREDLEVVAFHPGVVRTDLAARPGPLGALTNLLKRLAFEAPEACAERQAKVTLAYSPRRGRCAWLDKDQPKPWPKPARDRRVRREVLELSEDLLQRT